MFQTCFQKVLGSKIKFFQKKMGPLGYHLASSAVSRTRWKNIFDIFFPQKKFCQTCRKIAPGSVSNAQNIEIGIHVQLNGPLLNLYIRNKLETATYIYIYIYFFILLMHVCACSHVRATYFRLARLNA